MKKIFQIKLKILAKLILRKYRPKIIAITGSVGKTSTKEAVFHLLNKYFFVRTNPKNYNNEFGLPLTIIGSMAPGKSILAWLKIFKKALVLLLVKDKKYPKILILEMGIDKPGDMKYLTSIARPDISIVTYVGHSHFEFFGSLEKIQQEKQVLVEKTKNNGLVILNYDNNLTRDMIKASSSSSLTYGLEAGANLRIFDLIFRNDNSQEYFGGMHCKLNYLGSTMPIVLLKIVNLAGLYAVLSAIGVGLHFKLNLVEILSSFKDFSLPVGRMQFIQGINNSIIIDDSYNASPESTILSIKTLANLKAKGKKYAILGDMLEIGNYSEKGHSLVGEEIVKGKINYLITKGDLAIEINKSAINYGFNKDKAFHFSDYKEIIDFLKNNIKMGDVVLVKGSQGARMEKVIKEIMADISLAKDLLVRQGSEWEK
jgi:UDP-N-acetylmuramoyl-tripeptide--D-alanyl-D-alanine ligase